MGRLRPRGREAEAEPASQGAVTTDAAAGPRRAGVVTELERARLRRHVADIEKQCRAWGASDVEISVVKRADGYLGLASLLQHYRQAAIRAPA